MGDVLYYVADPMCSWCWGFHPVLGRVKAVMSGKVGLRYVMGGLAKDTEDPMPEETRAYVRNAWRQVSAVTGAVFNWEFWQRCRPRRSTFPACRAVLCAAAQREEARVPYFEAIQRAYYTEARNPSDKDTLVALAREADLDPARFAVDLESSETEAQLQADFALRRALGVRSFPTLILERGEHRTPIVVGYDDAEAVLARLASALKDEA